MRSIQIDWSYPMEINNILTDKRMSDIGIYYITRNFGGHVSDLYIGKTIYSYKSRLRGSLVVLVGQLSWYEICKIRKNC